MISELSIIIPTLNEEKYLPRVLQSILEQDYQGKLEIIIVDGKSQDNTLRVANGFKEKIRELIVVTSDRGISHQRNMGAQKARYKYLTFLDADMYLPRNFLSKITNKINPNENFVILPLILPLNGNLLDLISVLTAFAGIALLNLFKPITTGMCLITTKENHLKINGFNEKAAYAEDVDYGFRSVKNHAKYHFYLDCFLFSSVRRRKETGRIKLSLLWIRWYFDIVMHGAITDSSKYKYTFGNH